MSFFRITPVTFLVGAIICIAAGPVRGVAEPTWLLWARDVLCAALALSGSWLLVTRGLIKPFWNGFKGPLDHSPAGEAYWRATYRFSRIIAVIMLLFIAVAVAAFIVDKSVGLPQPVSPIPTYVVDLEAAITMSIPALVHELGCWLLRIRTRRRHPIFKGYGRKAQLTR